MHEFCWEDVDHKLADAKLALLSGDMQKKVADDQRRIHFEAAKRGNDAYFLVAFFEMQESRAQEWAREIYKVYCNVWESQGQAITLELAKSVYEKAVMPVLSVRQGTAEFEAELVAKRTGTADSPQLTACIAEWRRKIKRLGSSLWTEIEVDAREQEHASNAKKGDEGDIRRDQTMNIHLHNSQVGNLNLGTQIGTITATVQSFFQGDDRHKEFAEALKQLTEAVLSEQSLREENQKEIVDMLSTLAEQAAKKPAERSRGTLKAVLLSLHSAVSDVTKLADLWQKYEPAFRHFLGM